MLEWRPAAYGLGLLQVVVMCAMILFSPTVSVQTFVHFPAVANGTAVREPSGDTTVYQVMLGLPCLAMSAAVFAFVSVTFSLTDTGELDSGGYSAESLGGAGLWDALFWFAVACVHFIAMLARSTPGDVFAVGACTYLMIHFLQRICAPVDSEAGFSPNSINVVGYLTGLLLALFCVPPGYGNRYTIAFVLGAIDYFLCIGHTWDRAPTMATVASCRLFWACSASLAVAGLYGAWHDEVLRHLTSVG